MTSKGLVLVTGASGYIAGAIIQQLAAEGWSLRGTVRSPARHGGLAASLGLTAAQLPLFAADLQSDAGWAEAVAGCDYVMHIASPLPATTPQSAQDLIGPARDGALRALRFARDAGVKRLVMTSSVAAICYGRDDGKSTFDEGDWTDPDHPDSYPYVQSKTIAERAARAFMAQEGGGLEFVTINPSLVVGPVNGPDFSTSIEAISQLLGGKLPGCPRLGFAVVDVRDVAAAHVAAMTGADLNGERFIVAGPFLWMTEIAAILKRRLGARARRVPTRSLPDWLVRLSSLFNPAVRSVLTELGRTRNCDTSHVRAKLAWTPRNAEDSIVECAESLIAAGVVRV